MSSEIEKSLLSIGKGAGIIFPGMIIGALLGMQNQILLGRFLGPENYGLFNLGITLLMIFLPLTSFGLCSALVQFIPHNRATKRNDKVIGAIHFSVKFCWIMGIVISLLLFLLAPVIASHIFHDENLELIIKLLSLAFPFLSFYHMGMTLSQAFKKPKYYVYFDILLLKITQISIFIVLLFFGYALQGALAGYILSMICVSIAYFYITFNKFVPSLKCNKKEVHIKKELFSIGLPLFFAGFTYLFMQHTDRIVLGIYMTATDIGIYTAAFSIASLVLFILPAFEYLFLPSIGEFYGKKDFVTIKKLFTAISKWVFLLTFPLTLYVAFYSKNIILLIYGAEYTPGSLALIILLFGIAMNGLTGMTGNVLVGIRRTKLNLLTEIFGAISNVSLNILLIPKFGIIGAAIGTSISIAIRNLSSLGFVYKELKIHPYDRSYLKIIFCSIITLSVISFLLEKFMVHEYLFLIVAPIFMVVYFISLYKLKSFNDYDKMIIKVILRKIGFEKGVV